MKSHGVTNLNCIRTTAWLANIKERLYTDFTGWPTKWTQFDKNLTTALLNLAGVHNLVLADTIFFPPICACCERISFQNEKHWIPSTI